MRTLVIVLLMLALALPVAVSPTPETCDTIHALVGGELVEWIGYPQGWNLPDDLERGERVDFAQGGVWEFHSASEHARYVWVFITYTVDGEPRGAHDFCGPYRIANA